MKLQQSIAAVENMERRVRVSDMPTMSPPSVYEIGQEFVFNFNLISINIHLITPHIIMDMTISKVANSSRPKTRRNGNTREGKYGAYTTKESVIKKRVQKEKMKKLPPLG